MRLLGCWATALTLLAGCGGGGPELPVHGIVTMDNAALDGALVTFWEDKGAAAKGFGRTGTDGKFVVTGFKGQSGLPAGSYKVTVSKLKGAPTDEPVVAAVTEVELQSDLPGYYSNAAQTVLSYSVTGDGKAIEIKLTAKKK